MLKWLAEHWGSLIIIAALLALFVGSLIRRLSPKYRGQGGCAGCSGCQNLTACRPVSVEESQSLKQSR
ncbi:MAG: FeoB-associated Cys-rich membrane protein [Bacillota bacterium]|nr:FeoB-associated Cys-rich membrane protein [Bacillota bacterium]